MKNLLLSPLNPYPMKTLFPAAWTVRTSTGVLAMILSSLSALPAVGQVSQYTFSQTNETWMALTEADGGWSLGTPTTPYSRVYVDPDNLAGSPSSTYVQPVSGPGFPIGFNFAFNGDVFDRMGITSQGWIGFGKSSDGATAVNVYGSDGGAAPLSTGFHNPQPSYKRNRVAGFGGEGLRAQDMTASQGFASTLRMATIGSAPNRICVVEWKDFRRTFDWANDRVTFQIRLHETSNLVEVRYGNMQWGTHAQAKHPEIGLGGTSNADYNNRRTVAQAPGNTHDWNDTEPGVSVLNTCRAYSPDAPQINQPSIYPVPGLSFWWTAPTCPSPATPYSITGITFESATVSWNAAPGAVSYDYVVQLENDPDLPSPVLNGNTTSTTIGLNGLDALTSYYVFVRSVCAGQPGAWSVATPFTTQGGTVLICGGDPEEVDHCSTQHTTVSWYYTTSDGFSPIRLQLHSGYVGSPANSGQEHFRIYDGPDATGTLLYDPPAFAEIQDLEFTSLTHELYVELKTGQGSCASQPFYLHWEWTVGCMDCTEPLASYTVLEDCDNLQYSVQVLLVSMGSSPQLTISNTQGVPPTTVFNTGIHVVGPFAAGVPVTITLENPNNGLCNASSIPMVNDPCAVVDCGPTDYEYCYGNSEYSNWLYMGQSLPIGIRFRDARLGGNDQLRIHDAEDPFSVVPWSQTSGSLSNVLRTSTNPQHALFMELTSNAAGSCQDGILDPWDYVVACHDGCTQPTATFDTVHDCDNQQFSITVTLTDVGSTGSVIITNDGGAPTVPANATGIYTVGPFASLTDVRVEVEGGSVLCSWTSPLLTFDCTGIGMEEFTAGALMFHPNPNDGTFALVLPAGTGQVREVVLHDVAGRRVAERSVSGLPGERVMLDFSHLPQGMYLVTLTDGHMRHAGRLNIMR